MSELKVRRHIDEDTGIVFSFYGKPEADKVIAHNKYKRCMAMAEMCHALYDKYSSFAADPDNWESEDYYFARWRFFEKWMRKWLELAEKFKEAK